MKQLKQPKPPIDDVAENPKILGWAGGLLFALGLAAVFLAIIQDNNAEKSAWC